jgi:hypothetical protein
MAIIKRGILGGFSKSIGNIVGTSWKSIAIMKSKPLSVANPRTAGQVAQRNKFKSCVEFASLILASLIIPLLNRFAVRMSGYNMFVRLNTAFFDASGIITPASISLGSGKLGDTPITSGNADVSDAQFTLNYSNALDNAYKQSNDLAYALVVDSVTQKIQFAGINNNDQARNAGIFEGAMADTVVVGRTYWAYLVFLRADGTIAGNTAYRAIVGQA